MSISVGAILGGAAISQGGSIAGSVLGNYYNRKAEQRQLQYSKELMDYQNNINLQNAAYQDYLNSYGHRMAQARKAGLNPNLVAGQIAGVGTTNIEGVSQGSTPQVQPYNADWTRALAENTVSTLNMIQKARQDKVMADYYEKLGNKADTESVLNGFKAITENLEGKQKEIILKTLEEFKQEELRAIKISNGYNAIKSAKANFELSMQNKYGEEQIIQKLELIKAQVEESKASKKVKDKQVEQIDEQINDIRMKQYYFYPLEMNVLRAQAAAAFGSAAQAYANGQYIGEKTKFQKGLNRIQELNSWGFDNEADFAAWKNSKKKGKTWNPNYQSGYWQSRREGSQKAKRPFKFGFRFMGTGVDIYD